MKLILILGSQAVGKMTVGQELTKITDLKLMHNHMMIEPVLDIFGKFDVDTIMELRNVIFRNFLKTDNYGLIFTLCMNFDSDWDWTYTNDLIDMFEKENAEIYVVELRASKEIRLERNKSENRLLHKKSKRNIEYSEHRINMEEYFYRYESMEDEIPWKNHLVINNENLSAEACAEQIKRHFNL